MNKFPQFQNSTFQQSVRRAEGPRVPQDFCKAMRQHQLPRQFRKDIRSAVLVDEGCCRNRPFLIESSQQFQEKDLEIVSLTDRRTDSRIVARVEIDQDGAIRRRVIQDIVEMHIAMGPRGLKMAALNLMNAAQFTRRSDNWFQIHFAAEQKVSQAGARYLFDLFT